MMVNTMKINVKKPVLWFGMFLVASHFSAVEAHNVVGAVAPGSTDIYNFQCFTDTPPWSEGTQTSLPANRVFIRLVSASGAGVSAQIGHIPMGIPATQNWRGQIADFTTGASALLIIPPVTKTAGVWTDHGYNLTVRNTSAQARTYNVEYHCRNGALHSGTGAIFSNSQTPTADYSVVINN